MWYSPEMEKTTIYLPSDLQRSLVAAAKSEGRSQADIIRSALEAYVTQRPAIRPSSIGAGSDSEVSGALSEDWLRRNWKIKPSKTKKTNR
jgi:predicted transcriptional regulator